MELVGLSAIAAELKVSRQRVLQLRRREDFPEPVGETARGAIWDLDEIRRWARTGTRPAGRPSAESAARVIGNRFVLEAESMGSGPRSEVFRVTDRRFGTPAAIKFLDLSETDAVESRRFEIGLRTIEAIGHPNVMPVTAHGLAPDGRKWVAMPLATASLADHMSAVGRSPGSVADVMRQLCSGLSTVHLDGVVHGDIKPENVLRREDGAWALTDFCLPLSFTDVGESEDFVAPELRTEGATPTVRSDVYSLGRLIAAVFGGSDRLHLFSTVVDYATDPDPSRRYGSVRELGDAINHALTATQEIQSWASPQVAAEELRDRALGAATPPEDLYRILEWGQRLDEEDDESMRALTRVFPWLNERALKTLVGQNRSLFESVFGVFTRFVERGEFDNEYCDEFALFAQRANRAAPSPKVFGMSVRYLAHLGKNHERWHVRDVLVELLTHVQDDRFAEVAVAELQALPKQVARWNITAFALRAMPSSIRLPLTSWLDDQPSEAI